jgi:hypothetical protein
MRRSVVTALFGGLMIAGLVAGAAAPAGADGEANGIRAIVNVLGGTLTTVPNTPHVVQPPGGSQSVLGLPGAAAPAATASVLNASADPSGSAASVARLTAVNGVVPGMASLLTADVISSQCSGTSGSSSILNGTLAGNAVPVSAPPNTVIPIPLVGSATLNEQITSTNGITVRAIHLSVNVLGVATADVVISESVCVAGASVASATIGNPNLTG